MNRLVLCIHSSTWRCSFTCWSVGGSKDHTTAWS